MTDTAPAGSDLPMSHERDRGVTGQVGAVDTRSTDSQPGYSYSNVLFVGKGRSVVPFYRCYSPALHLGADWCGIAGKPPEAEVTISNIRGEWQAPNFEDYEIVVLQQPSGEMWMKAIDELKSQGVKIVIDIDDHVQSIRFLRDHAVAKHFGRRQVEEMEEAMRAADAVIVSTDWLGEEYKALNENVYVCKNAIDKGRYQFTRPERDWLTVGWAGGTGHRDAVAAWYPPLTEAMNRHNNLMFVTIGEPMAYPFQKQHPNRANTIPFCSMECYPAAMTNFDIVLAPAGTSGFYRGKSDLRWLEASALGLPVIADPLVYPEIVDNETGFLVTEPDDVLAVLEEFAETPEPFFEVGRNAQRYVLENREMGTQCEQWVRVFEDLS